MTEFNAKKIKASAKKDFEKAWKETAKQVLGSKGFRLPKRKGKAHLLTKQADKARKALLGMGFDEVLLRPIWEKEHVRLQYGPEAPAILDRLYYLAALPRPDIGLSDAKKKQIGKRIPGFKRFGELQKILMDYKRGEVEAGEDFTEALVTRLKLSTEDAHHLIDKVFTELKKLKPKASTLSLLSHATTGWFPTLQAVQGKRRMPLMLFALPWRFRREQREDSTHLRAHLNISMVVMDKNIGIEDGKRLTEQFFRKLGFKVKFKRKPTSPAYYAPGTNYEVFVRDKRLGWVEVSEIGMFSPLALANYDIRYPVFNSGPGLGRMAMVKEGIKDIREAHFPEFYGKASFTDEQLARSISVSAKPSTDAGRRIVAAVKRAAKEHANDKAPVEVKVWSGKIGKKNVGIKLVEVEEGKKLLGPAALNRLWIRDGSIIGDVKKRGLDSGISYLDGIANLVAATAEKARPAKVRVGMVKSLSDVNLEIPDNARRFITDSKKKMDVRGPVFASFVITVSKDWQNQ